MILMLSEEMDAQNWGLFTLSVLFLDSMIQGQSPVEQQQ